jgi:hypothetical protein
LRLFDFQPRLIDGFLVHRHLTGDAGAKFVGAFGHHRQPDVVEFFIDVRTREDDRDFLGQPIDNGLRRSSGGA